jgi:DNA replication licensing factor MCM3
MKAAVAEYMSKRESQKRIQTLIGKSGSRLDVNLDDLRGFSPDLAKYVAKNPIDAINMFESQLERSVQDLKDDQQKGANSEKQALANANDRQFPTKVKKYYVSFEGNFGANHVTPRGLKANLVNQFVSV